MFYDLMIMSVHDTLNYETPQGYFSTATQNEGYVYLRFSLLFWKFKLE